MHRRVSRLWARSPWVLAGVGYLVVAGLLLGNSIRPGRTLVPADILAGHPPYRGTFGGVTHNPLVSDAAFQFHPWLTFLDRGLDAGRLPQWNPHLLAGTPVTPNGYVSTYYPAFWLARVTDATTTYNLFVYLHLVLGAMGVYAFSRVVGARRPSAWLAGCAALGALFWVHWSLHLVHLVGMVWLPVVLAAVHALVRRPSAPRVAALAACFGLWWLGANPQYAYFGTLAAAGYGAALLAVSGFRDGARRAARPAAFVAAGLILGAALAGPILWPSATVGGEILRRSEPVEAMSETHLPLVDLALMVVPDARGSAPGGESVRPYPYGLGLDTPFVGLSVLVLAVAAMGGRHRPERSLLAAGALVALVLAFWGPPHHLLHALAPGYDRFRVSSRWLAVLPAFALPLAALGLDRLRDADRAARRLALGGLVTAAGVVAAFGVDAAGRAGVASSFVISRSLFALVPGAVIGLALWLGRSRPSVLHGLVSVAVVSELAVQVPNWFPSVRRAEAFPDVALTRIAEDRGGRLLRVGPRYESLPNFAPDLPMSYGLDDAQGQAVLFPAAMDRYLRLVEDYGDFAVHSNTAPPVTEPSRLASPLLDALDVRTLLAPSNVVLPPSYRLVRAGEPDVYARESPGPAVLVRRADPASPEQAWRRVADPRWDPVATSAVVGLPAPVLGTGGDVARLKGSPDHERWRVRSDRGGLLRISGAWAPGWSARSGGRDLPVLRADGVFRGVVVPPGDHLVEFLYRNRDEARGRALAALALAVLAALMRPWRLAGRAWRSSGPAARRRMLDVDGDG